MAVYLIGFALSLGLIAFSEKKRPAIFWSCSVIAILIPCLIAGLRAQTIGTDVMVYVKPLTQSAIVADDLKDYFNTYWFSSWRNVYVKDYEYGFSLLVYIVAKLTKSLGGVLFVIEAMIVVPIYVALSRNRKNIPIWLGMAVFYFMFYNTTLNSMRQWIAMAFLLLAMQMLLEKRGGLAAFFTVFALLFHSSAIMAFPIYAVYWFVWLPRHTQLVHNQLAVKGSALAAIMFFVVAILVMLNLDLVAKLLTSIGLSKFNIYIQGKDISLAVNQIILRLPFAAILLLHWKSLCRNSPAAPFYLAMLLMDIVTSQLVSIVDFAIRIGYYVSVYSILWLPTACASSPKGAKKTLSIVFFLAYAAVYWYYSYVLQLRSETYPYAFAPYFQ